MCGSRKHLQSPQCKRNRSYSSISFFSGISKCNVKIEEVEQQIYFRNWRKIASSDPVFKTTLYKTWKFLITSLWVPFQPIPIILLEDSCSPLFSLIPTPSLLWCCHTKALSYSKEMLLNTSSVHQHYFLLVSQAIVHRFCVMRN